MIRFLLLGSLMMVMGCASTGRQVSRGDTRGSASSDLKTREYEALKDDVNSFHASSLVGPDKPWLFNKDTVEVLPREFAKKNCPTADNFRTVEQATTCSHLFNRAAFNMLSEAYFAADTNAVGKKCAEDILVCTDLMAIEALFRRLHNESIEESKREKLASLDDWRSGKLSDDELKAQLHLDFEMKDGKLVISLPGGAPRTRSVVVGDAELSKH